MQVDPFTGQPISTTEPIINQGPGPPEYMVGGPNPTWVNTIEHLPGLASIAGWNAWRIRNTIFRGGFSGKPHPEGFFRGATRNHNFFRARTWGRLSSVDTLKEFGTSNNIYSPFDATSRAGNWLFDRSRGSSRIAKASSGRFAKLDEAWDISAHADEGRRAFGPGLIGRVGAYGKGLSYIDKLDRTPPGKMGRGARRASRRLNTARQFASRMAEQRLGQSGGRAFMRGMGSKGMMQSQFMFSQFGSVNWVGGYVSGATGLDPTLKSRANRLTHFRARDGARAGAKTFLNASTKATEHLADAGLKVGAQGELLEEVAEGSWKRISNVKAFGRAAKAGQFKGAAAVGARMAPMAARVAGPIGAAFMAYDITKMGGAMVGGGVRTLGDSLRSFKGQIDKAPFGMGYRDNQVAATNRQIGIQAIQNSRVNARSILGNEAGMVYSHFG